MKTEPTEAYRMIEEDWYAIPYMGTDYPQDPDIVVDKKDVYEIAKNAFQEGQSSPKIKQLEWDFYGTYYSAKTPVASYLITQEGEFIENYDDCELWVNASLILRGTHEEANAAAQEHFEQRVKECLIIE